MSKKNPAPSRKLRRWTRRLRGLSITAGVIALIGVGIWKMATPGHADPKDPSAVAEGRVLYARECATDCHGDRLQGQPNWTVPKWNGKLPAPPHDVNGHTWHHGDPVLFEIVKKGMASVAPPGYVTDMPAYGDRLSDKQIWAILSYIESTWPDSVWAARARHVAAGH